MLDSVETKTAMRKFFDARTAPAKEESQEVHMSEEDLQLLITLDDPWNAQECDTFYNQEAEEWKGKLRTGTALRLKNWPTDSGRREAAPSARPRRTGSKPSASSIAG
jgi:hypothetical protein